MGKFSKGQYVRRVTTSAQPEQFGALDGVYKVLDERPYGIVVIPGSPDADPSAFEPWQPRVGERVRVINSTVVSHWNEFWAKENGVKLSLGDFVYVTNFIPDYLQGKDAVEITAKQNGSGPRWLLDKFEPILTTATATSEQPATLKIEEGKFYKTRDGRKVGPMEFVDFGDGEPWHTSDTDRWWSDDGTRRDGSIGEIDDLIAEWIDEPVAKPEASNDNAEPKFKVGDAIRHKALRYEGVVTAVIYERTVRTHWTKEGWGATDPIDEIELITPPAPKTTTIVALIENGQPKPSSTPHVHASTGAAEKEAKRLAAKFKGKQFGVFTLTTTHHEPKPVYDHKWQNMAALGLKIDAIRELRSITGMGLKPAKDAVEYFLAAA